MIVRKKINSIINQIEKNLGMSYENLENKYKKNDHVNQFIQYLWLETFDEINDKIAIKFNLNYEKSRRSISVYIESESHSGNGVRISDHTYNDRQSDINIENYYRIDSFTNEEYESEIGATWDEEKDSWKLNDKFIGDNLPEPKGFSWNSENREWYRYEVINLKEYTTKIIESLIDKKLIQIKKRRL